MSTTAGTKPTFLRKQPGTDRNFAFDIGAYYELRVGGETITSVGTITASPSGLTFSAGAISGSEVQFTAYGGTTDTEYVLSIPLVLSGGSPFTFHPTLRVETF